MDNGFWNHKRVLVTGGAGFVGRWLVRTLSAADIKLEILDLAEPKSLDREFVYHATDLCDLKATQELLTSIQPDIIFHLAGQPGVPDSHNDPVGAYQSNVLATFNLLEACRIQSAPPTLLAVSSNHVYGDQEQFPTKEDAGLNGLGMYAASKLCSDVLARAYGKTYNLPVGIARMTNSFGGDDHHVKHIITATILSALKGESPVIKQSGKDRKGYLYIKDTTQGLIAIAEGVNKNKELHGEAFNIVPNDAITVSDLVTTIVELIQPSLTVEVQRPDAHFEVEYLDNSKAKRLLSWAPKYSFQEGLQETIQWYREQSA